MKIGIGVCAKSCKGGDLIASFIKGWQPHSLFSVYSNNSGPTGTCATGSIAHPQEVTRNLRRCRAGGLYRARRLAIACTRDDGAGLARARRRWARPVRGRGSQSCREVDAGRNGHMPRGSDASSAHDGSGQGRHGTRRENVRETCSSEDGDSDECHTSHISPQPCTSNLQCTAPVAHNPDPVAPYKLAVRDRSVRERKDCGLGGGGATLLAVALKAVTCIHARGEGHAALLPP